MTQNGKKISDIKSEIHKQQNQKRIDKVTTHKKFEKHQEWRKDVTVDLEATATITKSKQHKSAKCQNFGYKLRKGMFETKNKRFMQERRDSNYWRYRYKEIEVKDDKCDLCREAIDDEFHYLSCKKNKAIREEMDLEILNKVKQHCNEPISNIPNFWNIDSKSQTDKSVVWQQVESFNKQYGARGIIPKALKQFLNHLKLKQGTTVPKLIEDIQIIIIEGGKKMWIHRCKVFYIKHRRRRRR